MARWKDSLYFLVATCGGFGLSPIFPGTAGALWGIPIFVAIASVAAEPWCSVALAAALVVVCVVTVGLGRWAERRFDEKDSGRFVTDEVAGFLLTVLLFRTPSFAAPSLWLTVVWAFSVTRVIDIVKVPPARRLEHLPGGWGVLADDLLGSVYAAGLLHLAAFLLPAWFGRG